MSAFGIRALRSTLKDLGVTLPPNVIPYGFSSHSGGVWIVQNREKATVGVELMRLAEAGHTDVWFLRLDSSRRDRGLHKGDEPDGITLFSASIAEVLPELHLGPTDHPGGKFIPFTDRTATALDELLASARITLAQHQIANDLARQADVAENEKAFEPEDTDDARQRVLAAIVRRQGQPAFRRALLQAYGGRCAVTGCGVEAVLEAAHISPYLGAHTNHVTNGLLLRADIHTLFDLGHIAVDTQSWRIIMGPALRGSTYERLATQVLNRPEDPALQPNAAALDAHRRRAGF